MKRIFYICLALLSLLLTTSCDEENTPKDRAKNVDLKYLPGSWVMKSYETSAQSSNGQYITTTTQLDESLVITIYEDMLFTLSGKGYLLAEGVCRIDVSRLEIGLNEYTLVPETELDDANQILFPILTSKTLHIDELEENQAELSLKYSESVTITAHMRRTASASITGNWIYARSSAPLPEKYQDIRISCRSNNSFTWTSTTDTISGSYTYDEATHLLSATTGEEQTEYDVVCTPKSLRIASSATPDTKLYLTREE